MVIAIHIYPHYSYSFGNHELEFTREVALRLIGIQEDVQYSCNMLKPTAF